MLTRTSMLAVLVTASALFPACANSRDRAQRDRDDAVATSGDVVHADNTQANRVDRGDDDAALTAGDQSNRPADLRITRMIRKAITGDGDLSTYAHNVKIITINGHVTLRGPVRTEAERRQVVQEAVRMAGVGKVTDRLALAPSGR